MIVPDINLLIYAYNADAPMHAKAKTWWEGLMNGARPVGIPWVVACGFIRLMTHSRILNLPMQPEVAGAEVESWFAASHVRALNPGSQHLTIFNGFLTEAGVGGNLVTDAHIAAIAVEHQAELHSNDTDFSRFSGLTWRNPLQKP